MTHTTKWLIERDLQNAAGAVSTQRPSTDAVSALARWEAGSKTRSFDIPVDKDAFIHAVLRSEESDADAGIDLLRCCAQFGVKPVPLD